MSITREQITEELEGISFANDFEARTNDLTAAWSSAGAGLEIVEPILRFMESHPALDFGPPGPLVHFVEQFTGVGYEEKLVESFERKPTAHTAWMLNRLISGAPSEEKRHFISTMKRGLLNPAADQTAKGAVSRFLERLSSIGEDV